MKELLEDANTPGGNGSSKLLVAVYDQLRVMAESQMRRERGDHTLQATALVNEAYFRLMQARKNNFQSPAHFFGAAAEVMRRVLVEHARAKNAAKRGGGQRSVQLDSVDEAQATSPRHVLRLDAAITALEAENYEAAQVAKLKYFTAMTIQQICLAMDLTKKQVETRKLAAEKFIREFLVRRGDAEGELD